MAELKIKTPLDPCSCVFSSNKIYPSHETHNSNLTPFVVKLAKKLWRKPLIHDATAKITSVWPSDEEGVELSSFSSREWLDLAAVQGLTGSVLCKASALIQLAR
jgi:hypothetical protein